MSICKAKKRKDNQHGKDSCAKTTTTNNNVFGSSGVQQRWKKESLKIGTKNH
jgi:hypothetical protein